MKPLACVSLLLVSAPVWGARFPAVPKEVWAMRDDAGLVAKGAVILERKLDFQPFHIDQTVRIRILSQAGQAAAEFPDMPANLMYLEGQVTFPDGRVQPITKRDDFLVRTVVSTRDGSLKEGVLVPPGLTQDCVVDLWWRELTARGKANQARMPLLDLGTLPERCGNFWYVSLASAFPTQTVVVQKGQEVFWPMALIGTSGFSPQQGSNSQGTTYTFRNLPALPAAPYSIEINRPCPKVLFYRPIETLEHLDKVPAATFWQKTADLYYKDYFNKFVHKGVNYAPFSQELRKDLKGGPLERARTIAERMLARVKNLDEPLFDEKPPTLARHQVNNGSGVWDLDYTARTGFTDDWGMNKLLFHLLVDEGLKPKVALVADRGYWTASPETRTPFQFSRILFVVDEPGQGSIWLDPTERMVQPGQMPYRYEGTRAVLMDSATWQAEFRTIAVAQPRTNTRAFTYEIDATGEAADVKVKGTLTGAPALLARKELSTKSPSAREAWFKGRLERNGITVNQVQVANALEITQPLGFTAAGAIALEPGRTLKLRPFPGMDAGLYLPETLPEQRLDPILMPYLGVQEAMSIIKVPKGYVLREPIRVNHSNRWGSVLLRAVQDPDSGDVRVDMRRSTSGFLEMSDGYVPLKEYLQWVRAVSYPEITLERAADAKP
ncbi:hypothetical protein [Mesoterricola sediminis]|uniref:DUF3857 domain-containing protein n=1 Tax=Mesoterricola sediminis TaxID=2927980 RepID=A0AA48H1E4_9BACT|nr:hypothetical protein [Mesoterricola sediminis]BDU77852.1 hypothetical protein METESE_28100 [Mesoterricola sediminis]